MLPHSLGIGGGFVAIVYTKETGRIETLIARETAPAAATSTMFCNKRITGAIAACIPSEIYGYWCLHKKYGKLPWKMLFSSAIDMCFQGHKVGKHLAAVLNYNASRILTEPTLSEIFINPITNLLFKEGEIMYRPQLGETLKILANEGPESLYRGGRLAKLLVEDIQEMGGIITEDDLKNYEARWEEPLLTNFFKDYVLYTTPLPTSGVILAFILNVMNTLYTSNRNVYWQRLIETFKHAYGHRTNLGDAYFEPEVVESYNRLLHPEFINDVRNLITDKTTNTDVRYYGANFTQCNDHGTANVSVLAPNGDAISMTSTINSHLGAKVRSRQTGIILNDEMDDFSTPGVVNIYGLSPSPANFIKPGKRPLSSTCPSMVLDKQGNLQLLVGGAGGAKITTAVAQSILRYFVLNESIETSVNSGRLHHQLAPMCVDVESSVQKRINNYLIKCKHQLNYLPPDKAFSALTAIGLKTDIPQPICDGRRVGSTIVVNVNRNE